MIKSIRDLNIPLTQIKQFEVTGVLYRSNKRFKDIYCSFNHAIMINLWKGSVWARLDTGKRILLKRVNN